MLSHYTPSKQANKYEDQSMGGGGGSGRRNASSLRPSEQTLKCPRCDSYNTKFCYYNNNSLAQPRHFCKACRRHWTKGGALRNVPIGGSCKKNKKTKSCSSKCLSSKFFCLSTLHFNHGWLNFPPRVASYGDASSNHSLVNIDHPLGYNNLSFSSSQQHNRNGVEFDLASSIESLSSINQDLHWKLQQQRLSMLFGGEKKHVLEPDHQKLQPILFQNLETSKPAQYDSRKENTDGCGLATEWFFDNSYQNPTTSTNSITAGNDENGYMKNWNRIQPWNHLNHSSSAP